MVVKGHYPIFDARTFVKSRLYQRKTQLFRHRLSSTDEMVGEYMFMVNWISHKRFKQTDREGRDRYVRRTECRYAVICDLEGNSRYWTTRHKAARKITR